MRKPWLGMHLPARRLQSQAFLYMAAFTGLGAHMATLVVGGDNIASISDELRAHGETDIVHWAGRKHGDKHNVIPRDTQCTSWS